MRKLLLVLIPFVMISLLPAATADDARLLQYPDIHGDTIVFAYAGNLWTVSAQGGVARKITSHEGMEQFPKFSPDGSRIAFTASYDGNSDVYVMPALGGAPERLTYHPGVDQLLEWYPDGQSVLFRSRRASFWTRFNRLFKVSADGGFPEMLPLPTGELTTFNTDGTKIAYNRMSREFRTWKRYRGGMTPNIWIYDLPNNTIEEITPRDANDMFPMWQDDTIYFLSDRNEQMRYNLYAYDTATKQTRQLTDYTDYDIQWPSIGPDAIVYQYAGYLHVLDLKTEQPRRLTIQVYDEGLNARPGIKNVTSYIQNFGISPTGVRAVFEARGEIFTVPAEKGEIRNLTRTPGIRERAPVWSPDGKWIAYVSDETGEYEVYIRTADGKEDPVQITQGSSIWYDNLSWSPDSKKLMLSDAAVNLFYLDIEDKKLVKVDHGDYEGTGNFIDGVWSPDSRWIAYDKNSENGLNSIYLFSLDTAESHKITSDMTDDRSPAFDPDGKYLFFVANREHNYSFSAVEFLHYHYNPGKVVVVTLQADTPSPFAPESDEEKVKEDKNDKEKEKKAKDEGAKPEPEKEDEKTDTEAEEKGIQIDLDGIESRLIDLPIPDGNYLGVEAAKGLVYYVSVDVPGTSGGRGATIHVFDLKKREAKPVIAGIMGADFSADGKKILIRQGPNFAIIDAKPGQKPGEGKLNLTELNMNVVPREEWNQMFLDAWRITRDFFYDPDMHGVDWPGVKEKYGVMLPHVAHRDDLNFLLGEMIGELCSSHTYRGGGDYPNVQRVDVGLLGCDFELDEGSGYYRIAKIYPGQNWDPNRRGPLAQPGLKVNEGDYIIAVAGEELKAPRNPYAPFVDMANKAVVLLINSEPKAEGAREITVTPTRNELALRYRDWVDTNRRKVEEATNGRVGYLHLPATAAPGVEGFSRDFYPQVRKDALIFDVRYNSGGHIPDIYMNRLDRQLLGLWKTRYTEGFITPGAAHYGPKVCIINSYAGSGGDAFPFFFRELGLGPLIGTRTWGGLIGLSGNPPLMDNGGVSIADFAFFNAQGKWDVENKGVSPDIEVDDRPDLMVAGRDPSLEKAIEVILEKLAEQEKPPVPQTPATNPKR
jgi:tricorn protease